MTQDAGEQSEAAFPIDLVVVGLGYVGMPLAQEGCRRGLRVVGLDVDEDVVAGLSAGRSHIDDLSDSDVAAMLSLGFAPTTDPTVIAGCATVVICVPTPLADGGPDLRAVLAATATVAGHVRAGALVVLESTTYPGTTEEIVLPALAARGLSVGEDVFLAFSPERIDPGNASFGFANTPKVVGGVTQACTQRAAQFYGGLVDRVVRAKGTREAEMAKLLENTYRHVNIALVNEMARFCHELDIDLWDVIACASTKPFGFQSFYPGPGVGGHCIPIDPNYLSYRVRERLGYPFRFVELAQEINHGMPAYVVRRVQDLLNDQGMPLRGASIVLLGVTYKPDIADQRESPAVPLAVLLRGYGAHVSFHDPYVTAWQLPDGVLECAPDLGAALAEADLVVLVQPHAAYDLDQIPQLSRMVFDTRGRLPQAPNVVQL